MDIPLKLFQAVVFLLYFSFVYSQEDCSSLQVAVTGDNTVSLPAKDYWYTYTMINEDHKLVLTTSSFEVPVSVYNNSCDNLNLLGSNLSNLVIGELEAGEVVYIKWTGGNFTWNLTEQPVYEGHFCYVPITAVLGENEFNENGNGPYYWYTYTMVNDNHKLVIDNPTGGNTRVYTNTCEHLGSLGFNSDVLLSAGETVYVYIELFGQSGTWTLSEQPLSSGDVCEMAKPAENGDNVLETSNDIYWYSYTMQNDHSLLKLTAYDSERVVVVYTNSCGNLVEIGRGYQYESVIGLKAGDEVIIQWYGGNFTWNLSELSINSDFGDICEVAETASLGWNTVPDMNDDYWYTYTMNYDELSITSEAEKSVSIYTNTCEHLVWLGTNYENITVSGFSPGETVFIKWTSGNISWKLDEQPVTPPNNEDNSCETAKNAISGANFVPELNNHDYWYTYTMNDVQLTLNSSSGSTVAVYSGNCENLVQLGQGFENLTISELSPGETIYVRWFKDNFSWTLTDGPITGPQTGDNCELAEQAVLGENVVPTADSYWYTYVMQNDNHWLTLTSNSSGVPVTVYNNTCENLQELETGSSGMSLKGLAAGERVYIRWFDGDLSWNLSEEPRNLAPDISDINDQTIDENSSTSILSFNVSDNEDEATQITLSGGSSNPSIVSNDQIVFGGSSENRTVQVTPNDNQHGKLSISIIALDSDGHTNVSSFILTVNNVNQVPEIVNPVEDIYLNSGFESTQIDIGNVFTDADEDVLNIESITSDSGVVEVFVSGNQLNIEEVGVGMVDVTLIADDGFGGTAQDVFSIHVSPLLEVPNQNPTEFELYPNPTSKHLHVRLGEDYDPVKVLIYNRVGTIIFEQQFNNSTSKVDVSMLTSGVYFLRIETTRKDEVISFKRVIKL